MKKILATLLSLFFVHFSSTAHYQPEETLYIVGSTSVAQLIKITEKPFYQLTGYRLLMRPLGSDKGVISIAEKVSDVGVISRYLTKAERQAHPELLQLTIAQDAVVFIANQDNDTNQLSYEQVRNIYTKDTPLWENKQAIQVYGKNIGHGTHDSFLAFFKLESMLAANKTSMLFKKVGIDQLYSNNQVVGYDHINQAVAKVFRAKSAIAFDSLGAYQHFIDSQEFIKTKLLSFDGQAPIVNGQINPKYTFKRPLNIITNDQQSDIAKRYIEFLASEQGQKLLAENFFIPI